jgi:LysM repeat protein
MDDERTDAESARTVFAGLVPNVPLEEPTDRGRVARGVRHTVPILLVGSMAATMLNVTGPIESAQAKRLPGPKAAATDPGKTVREAIAAANASAAAVAATVVRTVTAPPPATYRVVAGDTVSDIAGRFGLSTASVLALNGLGWSSLIFPGQELKLGSSGPARATAPEPEATAGGQYTIVAGDTISGIADRFGVSTLSVLGANGLGWNSIIYPGQIIVIPGLQHPADPVPAIEEPEATATPERVSDEAPVVDTDPIVTVPVVETAPIAEPPVEAAPAPAPPAPAPAGTYTIVSGDTISRIAAAFGISSQALLDANGLDWSSVIYPGGTLVIPAGGSAPAPAPAPASSGGSVTPLNDEMRANAAIIVQVGREQGVPDYGIIIALATAMQESSLRNLTWGDRDSVGLFQQRPSSGWGSVEELTNPHHAAYLFYQGRSGYTRGLLDISGWQSMALTVAAQRVQISAYPDAYAKWEASARAWFAELG